MKFLTILIFLISLSYGQTIDSLRTDIYSSLLRAERQNEKLQFDLELTQSIWKENRRSILKDTTMTEARIGISYEELNLRKKALN